MNDLPVYKSQLFQQIFKSAVIGMLVLLIALGFVLNQTIQSFVEEEERLVKSDIVSLTGNQIKRALLIEDISQLNSFAELIVNNERNGVSQFSVFIAGEDKPLVVYPAQFPEESSCRIESLPIAINEMFIGSMDICFNEDKFAGSLERLSPTIIWITTLGLIGLLILILRISANHVQRVYSISKAIKSYADGEKHVQVEVKNHNELGNLEMFFNQMVSKLNLSQDKLSRIAFYQQSTNLPNKHKLIDDLPKRQRTFEVNIFMIEDYDHIEQTFGEVHITQLTKSFVECLKTHLIDGAIYHVSTDVFIVLDSYLSDELMAHLTGKLVFGSDGDNEISLKVKGVNFNCFPEKGIDIAKTILRMVGYVKNKPGEFARLDGKAFNLIMKGYEIAENLVQGNAEGLKVFGQIIYPVNKQEWPHVELLVRYEDEKHGLLSPYFFLNQVIELGGIKELDRFMLAKAEHLMEKYQNSDLKIFINITPATLFSKSFHEWIHSHPINSEVQKRLVLEVNEAFFIEMEEESIEVFNQIHKSGFRLALDDFGSGFSSYSWLSQLPISYLKIDRSLILVEGDKADTVLSSISTLANDLGIITIDEGVETEEQYNRVIAHKINQVQGFYLDIPGPVEDKIQKILQARGLVS